MKSLVRVLFVSALASLVAFGAEESAADVEGMLSKEGSYEYNLVGRRLLRPIDEVLLKQLVAHPEESSEHDFVLSSWLVRIAAEGDKKYGWLLDSKELREGGETADLLLAYDYNVNGNREALDTLLNRLRKTMEEERTWSIPHLFALAAVNEWERCRQALGSHGLSADGAGNDERCGFWLKRRYFFPDDKRFPVSYQAFCRELEQLQAKREEE